MLGAVEAVPHIPLVLVAPFGLLLLLIAVMPLTRPAIKHRWEKCYPVVSIGVAVLVGAYYLWKIPDGGGAVARMLREYGSFIVMIGSLFVVAGGIHIQVKGEATPMANVVFLALGAGLANVIGTTGASMVLIRPWIRMNKIRASPYHVVFFIFLVSNVGGALSPAGNPPLFLGYLSGVPFFWLAERVIIQWLVTVAALLAAFYFFDSRSFHRLPKKLEHEIAAHPETWQFSGMINALFLLGLVGAVFLPEEWFPLREALMAAIAAASYFLTPKAVHEKNAFNFGPIKEVAILFFGIFGAMMPALGYLAEHGQDFGFTNPLQYYFACGGLSSVLDNAPAYLNFLQLAQTTAMAQNPLAFAAAHGDPVAVVRVLLEQKPLYVIGLSLGSVFFGGMTYIGNGPNFMVKSIAHDAGVHCPNFFAYIYQYSLPVLLPILVLCGWLFL
jgi:Na+/H+ antiporter NhaD/arsenite permease-like protein